MSNALDSPMFRNSSKRRWSNERFWILCTSPQSEFPLSRALSAWNSLKIQYNVEWRTFSCTRIRRLFACRNQNVSFRKPTRNCDKKKKKQNTNSHDEDKFSHGKWWWWCRRSCPVLKTITTRSFCVRSHRWRGNAARKHAQQPATPHRTSSCCCVVCLRTRIEMIVVFSPQVVVIAARRASEDATPPPAPWRRGAKYPDQGLGLHRNGRDADNDDALLLCSPSTGVIYWFATIDVSPVIVTTGRAQKRGIRGKYFVWAIWTKWACAILFVSFYCSAANGFLRVTRFGPLKSYKTFAYEITRSPWNGCKM